MVPYSFLLCQPRGVRKRRKLECSHGPVCQYAHTFVGKASYWAVRAFLPQGALSDSVKNAHLQDSYMHSAQFLAGSLHIAWSSPGSLYKWHVLEQDLCVHSLLWFRISMNIAWYCTVHDLSVHTLVLFRISMNIAWYCT